MTKAKPTKIPHNLARNWSWLLGLGILFVFLGCVGLSMVMGLTLASIFFLGILFLVAGVAQIIDTFKSRGWQGGLWHTLVALFYLVAGGLIMYDPILASAIITALIAWLLIFMGLTRLIMAIILRHTSGWGWLLVAGLTSFILGVLILMQWPFSALWVIGLFIAIELIVNGWTYIFIALAMRKK